MTNNYQPECFDFNFSGGGRDPNKPCVFPWIHIVDGIKYYGCVETVCPTQVDEKGVETGSWGYCGPDCRSHEETVTWEKEESIKMTLQYDNTVDLRIGLEIYGYLLSGVVLVGLILTMLIPAMGKIIVTIY